MPQNLFEGLFKQRPKFGFYWLRPPLFVVVRDEDALRPGEDPSAPLLLDLVAQCERGVPDFRWPDRYLNLIAPRRLRFEINLHMGQDEVDLIERPTVRVLHVELRPRELDVGQVDGVVDVTHPVDVTKPQLDVRGEARHPPVDAERHQKTFGWLLLVADEAGEFRGELESDLLRRIALDRGPRRQTRLRQLPVDRPREVDPTPKGLVDASNRLGRDAGNHAARGKLGVLSDHRATRDDRPRSDQGATID